jgi:hypothetical protein
MLMMLVDAMSRYREMRYDVLLCLPTFSGTATVSNCCVGVGNSKTEKSLSTKAPTRKALYDTMYL